jgi:hypothetical protein
MADELSISLHVLNYSANPNINEAGTLLYNLGKDSRVAAYILFAESISSLDREEHEFATIALHALHKKVNDVFGKFGIAKAEVAQRRGFFAQLLGDTLPSNLTATFLFPENQTAVVELLSASVDAHSIRTKAPVIQLPEMDIGGGRKERLTVGRLISAAWYVTDMWSSPGRKQTLRAVATDHRLQFA